MKTFEVWENIDYGSDSEKLSIGYIKAKNMENAVKRALKDFLTKEQRKNKTLVISDKDIVSYDFDVKYYDLEGNEITDQVDEFNEDTMNFENHEIVIEEKENDV